jgi:hypothetical protein
MYNGFHIRLLHSRQGSTQVQRKPAADDFEIHQAPLRERLKELQVLDFLVEHF